MMNNASNEFHYSGKENALREVLACGDYRIVDTQVFMDSRKEVDDFFAVATKIVSREPALRLSVCDSTLSELESQKDRYPAQYAAAMARWEQLTRSGTAEVVHGLNPKAHEASILERVICYSGRRAVVFTADRHLARELMNLGQASSLRVMKPEVFYLDDEGVPVPFQA